MILLHQNQELWKKEPLSHQSDSAYQNQH